MTTNVNIDKTSGLVIDPPQGKPTPARTDPANEVPAVRAACGVYGCQHPDPVYNLKRQLNELFSFRGWSGRSPASIWNYGIANFWIKDHPEPVRYEYDEIEGRVGITETHEQEVVILENMASIANGHGTDWHNCIFGVGYSKEHDDFSLVLIPGPYHEHCYVYALCEIPMYVTMYAEDLEDVEKEYDDMLVYWRGVDLWIDSPAGREMAALGRKRDIAIEKLVFWLQVGETVKQWGYEGYMTRPPAGWLLESPLMTRFYPRYQYDYAEMFRARFVVAKSGKVYIK